MDSRLDKLEKTVAALSASIEALGATIQKNQTTLQADIAKLGEENKKRSEEIRNLAFRIGQLATDDESTSIDPTAFDQFDTTNDVSKFSKPFLRQHIPTFRETVELPVRSDEPTPRATRVPAKDIVRTIRVLNGRDDIGVEDFIKAIKRARAQCSEEDLLLGLIIAEKITDQAERSIRHLNIASYDELYENLRLHVSPPITISNARSKLYNIKQGSTESIQSFNLRYRQQLNELRYAIQNKYPRPISRRIALEEEEETATAQYILNLRSDIGKLVIARDPQTLVAAQQIALEMETWTREAQNRVSTRSSPQPPSRFRPTQITRKSYQQSARYPDEKPATHNNYVPNHALPLRQRLQLKCTTCGKLGHEQNQCFKQNFRVQHTGKIPPRINNLKASMTTAEAEYQEYLEQADDYDTSPPNWGECANSDDSYSTQEQA